MQAIIERHEALVRGGGPLHSEAERLVSELQSVLADQAADFGIAYNEYTDALPPLLELLDIQIAEPAVRVEDIDPEEVELRRRTIREWKRWAAHRGTETARFRVRVRDAYRSTCLVCGKQYPPTPFNRVPGVDAAHILPWADYDLDRTDNGICLCKLCHWAFDEGILVVSARAGHYHVEVSQAARAAIAQAGTPFSLDVFDGLAGQVPGERLPARPEDWPNVQFLEELRQNQEV
ncbi:MAG: HNH endonuclease [Candidatus Tectomicrobia bacterium]|nr:HNH endonuclease [Candidatus Tectomicrobia bacterium]